MSIKDFFERRKINIATAEEEIPELEKRIAKHYDIIKIVKKRIEEESVITSIMDRVIFKEEKRYKDEGVGISTGEYVPYMQNKVKKQTEVRNNSYKYIEKLQRKIESMENQIVEATHLIRFNKEIIEEYEKLLIKKQ